MIAINAPAAINAPGNNPQQQDDIRNKLRNAQLAIRKWQCCAFANMNEVTRLLSRIAALETSSGRSPSNSHQQGDNQTDRNFYYHRYLGLLSVIKEGITEEDESQARAAQECFNQIQSFIKESLSDNSDIGNGLISIQDQLKKAKRGTECVECCICYMPLTEEDCCVMPKCWHNVHSSCFFSWARTNATRMGDHSD